MNDKISVIVPMYNVEKYIAKCLESVMGQTYENIEIIVIDDGSTDGSLDICNSYAQKDSRLTVVHQDNKGVSAARNKGLELATGDYIGFVDSDDYLEPEMYSILMNLMKENDAEITACAYRKVSPDGTYDRDFGDDTINVYEGTDMFRAYITNPSVSPAVGTKLYKREIFDGIRFIEGIIYEDKDVISRTFIKCQKGVFINKSLYNYRTNPDSLTHHDYTDKTIRDYVQTIGIQLDIVQNNLSINDYIFSAGTTYMILLNMYCNIYNKTDLRAARDYIASEAAKYVSYTKEFIKIRNLSKKDANMIRLSFISFKLYRFVLKVRQKLGI